MIKRIATLVFCAISAQFFYSQQGYWQQKVVYNMDIDFNDELHQFSGHQEIVYTNNSPDKLDKVKLERE